MSEQVHTVDGKTFEQYLAEQEKHTTPATAFEATALAFGLGGDIIEVAEDGTETARHSFDPPDVP